MDECCYDSREDWPSDRFADNGALRTLVLFVARTSQLRLSVPARDEFVFAAFPTLGERVRDNASA